MNEKIDSKVTLLKGENKGSAILDVTPIPHRMSKKFNIGIYRPSLLNGLGPKRYHNFVSGASAYMPSI